VALWCKAAKSRRRDHALKPPAVYRFHPTFAQEYEDMKSILVAAIAVSLLAGCAATHEPQAAAGKEAKIAFDFTDAATGPLIVKLETVEITRKQLVDAGYTPRIVMTFRGQASYYTQTDLSLVKDTDRADMLKVQSLIRQLQKTGAVERVEQCNIPLAPRKIQAANLMPEVKLVPNGWIALAEYQRQGYAYIAP
jgi:intracellular sulfur oxidation DsrE/DsrF family protein